jgi:hypothetical protein
LQRGSEQRQAILLPPQRVPHARQDAHRCHRQHRASLMPIVQQANSNCVSKISFFLFSLCVSNYPHLISPVRRLIAALEKSLLADLGVAHLLQVVPIALLHLRRHLSRCGHHCQLLTRSSSFCYCCHGYGDLLVAALLTGPLAFYAILTCTL